MHKEGEWRASKLVGVNVYNDANEKIGDINDVILDRSGKVENVVLGVGGFLGMGEHYVAVAYDSLKWSNEPPGSSTARPRHRLTTVRQPTLTGMRVPRPTVLPGPREPRRRRERIERQTGTGIPITRYTTRPRIS
jgi:sporulation protein YlmC with PRC-barrel domain